MALIRTFYKLTAIVLWSLLLVPMTFPFRLCGKRGLKQVTAITRLWLRGAARIANLKVKVHGSLPEQGALIVSNHLSYVDGIVEGGLLKLRWATRSDVARWPLVGLLVASSGTVWVDRTTKSASKKTLDEFVYTLRSGFCLLVWPEGTSTDGTDGLLPFKSTAFEAAVAAGVPAYPMLINYADPSILWYGEMTLLPHLCKILAMPKIDAELHVLEAVHPQGMDRKEFAEHVRQVMEREYKQIVRPRAVTPGPIKVGG